MIDTGKVARVPRKTSILKNESKPVQAYQKAATVPSKALPNSSSLAVKALTDMKAFAELIMFHGGWNNFGECHTELADFLTTPQVSKDAQWKLRAEGDEQGAYLRRLVLMPRGHLKALDDNSLVATPSGWKNHGSLVVGDFVTGGDGKPVKVTHVHPASVMSLYELTTRDGRVVKCNGEHLWKVKIPSNSVKPQVLSTNELLNIYKSTRLDKRSGKEYTDCRVFIDTIAFQGTHQQLPIDPYTLGAWLGDGTSSNGGFTTADVEILEYFPFSISKHKRKYGYGILGLCKTLRLNNLINNKHIPDLYFLSSYEQRLELLRGLMDTDGTCHKDGNIAYFSQSNYSLIKQVDTLVKSLGGVSSICAYNSSCNGKSFPTWSLSVKLNDCPFKLKRKVDQWKGIKQELKTAIVDIKPVGKASARCITIENADGVYLTNDYLPTHNSSLGTVLYVLWRIYRNPNIRVLVACNLQSLAFAFIRELRSYFENTKLDSVWNKRPHIVGALLPQLQKKSRDRNFSIDTEAEDRKVIWNNTALQVVRRDNVYYKEPTVYATSVGTTVTGQHYDLVILDDLIDFKNIESETKKTATEEWIADVESVLNPPENCTIEGIGGYVLHEILGGEIVVSGTRYAVDDYYAQVLEKAEDLGYQTHIRNIYKNGKDASDGYLWHEKYTDRLVASLKARLSPRRFASQYLNTVYEKDTSLFNTSAVHVIPDADVFSNSNRLCAKHPNGRIEIVAPIISIDPAFTTSKTSDDCAILLGFKFSDGLLCVVDAFLDRMVAAEVVANTVSLAKRWSTLRLFYEANGVGLLVPELFKTDASRVDGKQIICVGHYEQRSKESKIQGVLELPMNVGKIAVCQRVRDNEKIWKQMSNYPAIRHDDFLDGLVTLYEKTIPARELFNTKLQDISINGYRLNIDNIPDYRASTETYLSAYNSYYE